MKHILNVLPALSLTLFQFTEGQLLTNPLHLSTAWYFVGMDIASVLDGKDE